MSNRVAKMSNDINSLNLEKSQLLREKEESDKNFQYLLSKHFCILLSKVKNIKALNRDRLKVQNDPD